MSPDGDAYSISPLMDTMEETHPPSDHVTSQQGPGNPYDPYPSTTLEHGRGNLSSSPVAMPPVGDTYGGFRHISPKTSPALIHRRPARPVNGYQSFGAYMESSPDNQNPASLPSADPRYPLPPHLPQAHFYGAPEIGLGRTGLPSKQRSPRARTCCVFDRLPSDRQNSRRRFRDVLICGYSGSIEVYTVNRSRLGHVASLNGLRGSVLDAKILPCGGNMGLRAGNSPLVAIVVHGISSKNGALNETRPGSSKSEADVFDPSASMMHALHNAAERSDKISNHEQTTVEIYSLRTMTHVATLMAGPEISMNAANNDQRAFPASSNLRLQACGDFITVASGSSGEVFIFTYIKHSDSISERLCRCIGKVWTRTTSRRERSPSISSSASESDQANKDDPIAKALSSIALCSLGKRWLTVVPPPSSRGTTLHFRTDLIDPSQPPPGISSHAAPSEPNDTCLLDTPEAESRLNKVARDLTQEVFRGAQWLGTQGLQAWNSYWTKPQGKRLETDSTFAQQEGAIPVQPQLPPTHAYNKTDLSINETCHVALLDLWKLANVQHTRSDKALVPIATFSPPYGCSFVSLAPSGSQCLVSSKKGDVHQIWDLMGMVHGIPTSISEERVPVVRELVRFTRMTIAKVVEVAWTEPKGERLAIVTDNGTAHIYDLPASAFQWPPLRQKPRPSSAPSEKKLNDAEPDDAVTSTTIDTSLGARMSTIANRAQPLFSAVRGRPASVGSTLPNLSTLGISSSTGIRGSKVMAAGLRQSVDAATNTVSTFRHLGENRISLPAVGEGTSHRRALWLDSPHASLAVHGDGTFKLHKVYESTRQAPKKRRPSVLGSKPLEIAIPKSVGSPRNRSFSPTTIDRQAEGLASPMQRPSINRLPTMHDMESRSHPLSFAEIETNAPYQPFHTDARVTFNIMLKPDQRPEDPPMNDQWMFGGTIPCTRVSVGTSTKRREDSTGTEVQTAMESSINYEGNAEDGQQILVSTRRRRVRDDELEPGSTQGEFFDDDCAVVDFADNRV